ncbi:osmotically inducible protein OsmC [Flavobacterium branchiophilum NBRC 15030 = ATCC 35035]|uniref:Osmotically inducible protein OsmC n=2 Tax=Flavobacterium branchiophilum TaxID=55197 RepID=A0A2H3L0X2_9FLAO|nr:OsmC family protein [Flavobacterium branchiophilum]OXA76679.1 osmotically inducible protein OsmC [Flavobacterium branchiophilum NBRC 15030 = ATCC 35035]PDS26310.1 osmotically inducible protein OsmC [Flavobacterium branchiophilum]TQM41841.1 putative OsmC-like protein [Flavobacterium branchiophilum]CCB69413.1 Putative stress-induced protein OsmC [Flavobacterium branchiophilum FL-15]GEM56410.1 stress-induced protein OsmC [Flavobacterium branchiophilum NBRC 15030 = ATCC 35035]
MTSKVTYLGDLRTSSTHLQSGTTILSDAPTDNHGKGEAFSPTDLLANALGSCMLSIMAIKSKDLNVDLKDATADVTKIMQAEPRKISKIIIVLTMPITPTEKERTILERVALNCPVLLSLHPDIEKELTFNWQ